MDTPTPTLGATGGISTDITSQIASALYDPIRNALELGQGTPTLYRAIEEGAPTPLVPGNVSILRPESRAPILIALVGLILVALFFFRRP
jgi:hypothetical protein